MEQSYYIAASQQLGQLSELTVHNEQELMNQFRQGKEIAMSAIFDNYSRPPFYFALRYVQHTAEADDAAAEALIKLWNRKEEFETITSVTLFLHAAVKNRCLDYLRHKSVKNKSPGSVDPHNRTKRCF